MTLNENKFEKSLNETEDIHKRVQCEDGSHHIHSNVVNDKETEDLETLCDLFPSRPRTELIARLRSSRVEEVVEEIFREQDLNSDPQYMEFDRKVDELKAVFPHYNQSVLARTLSVFDDDLEMASNSLFKENEAAKDAVEDSPMVASNDKSSEWDSLQTKIKLLEQLTGLFEVYIRSSLHTSKYNEVECLIEIIKNHKPQNRNDIDSDPKITIPRGGRVQGAARTQFKVNTIKPQIAEPSYIYDENSPEAKELKAIYFGNPQFAEIDEAFFIQSFIFFKGDTAKVIAVATFIIENGSAAATHQKNKRTALTSAKSLRNASSPGARSFTALDRNRYTLSTSQSIASSVPPVVGAPLSNHFAKLSPSPSPVSYQSYTSSRLPSQSSSRPQKNAPDPNSSVLDLHSLTVSESVDLARTRLQRWWANEVAAREVDGRLHKYGSKAAFVPPLQLITGRGLHSADGVARIRKAVKAFLIRNSYLFEENTGNFLVVGRSTKP